MRADDFEIRVEFLKARLREDEAVARALKPGKNQDVAKLRDRVLADVEAKWRLMDWVEEYPRMVREVEGLTFWQRASRELCGDWSRKLRSPVIYELVAAYADHPDFRPEWLLIENEQRRTDSV